MMRNRETLGAAGLPLAFYFSVDIEGVGTMAFQEVSGLDADIRPVEFREGGNLSAAHRLPGRRQPDAVTLKRGVATDSDRLRDWINPGLADAIVPRTVTITLSDDRGQPVCIWKLTDAWVAKVTLDALNAKAGDVAIEALHLAYHAITKESLS